MRAIWCKMRTAFGTDLWRTFDAVHRENSDNRNFAMAQNWQLAAGFALRTLSRYTAERRSRGSNMQEVWCKMRTRFSTYLFEEMDSLNSDWIKLDKQAWRLGAAVLIRYLKRRYKSATERVWHKMRTRFRKAASASLRRVVKEFVEVDKATTWITKKYYKTAAAIRLEELKDGVNASAGNGKTRYKDYELKRSWRGAKRQQNRKASCIASAKGAA